MPATISGIGTKYYGDSDRTADGSYVTTEWLVFLYVPVVPVGSYRVLPTGKSLNAVVFSSKEYQAQRVPIHWRQVRETYVGVLRATLIAIGVFVLVVAGVVLLLNLLN